MDLVKVHSNCTAGHPITGWLISFSPQALYLPHPFSVPYHGFFRSLPIFFLCIYKQMCVCVCIHKLRQTVHVVLSLYNRSWWCSHIRTSNFLTLFKVIIFNQVDIWHTMLKMNILIHISLLRAVNISEGWVPRSGIVGWNGFTYAS